MKCTMKLDPCEEVEQFKANVKLKWYFHIDLDKFLASLISQHINQQIIMNAYYVVHNSPKYTRNIMQLLFVHFGHLT